MIKVVPSGEVGLLARDNEKASRFGRVSDRREQAAAARVLRAANDSSCKVRGAKVERNPDA
jgi:hypothetical protein